MSARTKTKKVMDDASRQRDLAFLREMHKEVVVPAETIVLVWVDQGAGRFFANMPGEKITNGTMLLAQGEGMVIKKGGPAFVFDKPETAERPALRAFVTYGEHEGSKKPKFEIHHKEIDPDGEDAQAKRHEADVLALKAKGYAENQIEFLTKTVGTGNVGYLVDWVMESLIAASENAADNLANRTLAGRTAFRLCLQGLGHATLKAVQWQDALTVLGIELPKVGKKKVTEQTYFKFLTAAKAMLLWLGLPGEAMKVKPQEKPYNPEGHRDEGDEPLPPDLNGNGHHDISQEEIDAMAGVASDEAEKAELATAN